jgi:hypothetical protein
MGGLIRLLQTCAIGFPWMGFAGALEVGLNLSIQYRVLDPDEFTWDSI